MASNVLRNKKASRTSGRTWSFGKPHFVSGKVSVAEVRVHGDTVATKASPYNSVASRTELKAQNITFFTLKSTTW